MVAADEDEHELVRVRLVGDGFDRLVRRNVEEVAEALNRVRAGRRDFFKRLCRFVRCRFRLQLRFFIARRVLALRAIRDVRLAGVSEHGEFVRVAAADRAAVGLDRTERQAHARVDLAVRIIHFLVRDHHAVRVFVERVQVFHDKLAAAHEAEARTALVAELVLDLVEHDRQLLVAVELVAHEVGNHLLMRRAEAEVAAMTVFDAHHLGAIRRPAAAFLPELARLEDRHHDFLAAGRVHLLADDLLDLADDAPAERQERVHAARDFADHAGTVHELVADDLGLGRCISQGWCIQV